MKINRIDIKGEVYDIEAYENPIPTGSVFPFAGITAPEGFLLCNGQEVSRFTYAKLYGVISDTYGAGDGTTTFNLPDYREVTLVGAGTSGRSSIKAHDIYAVGEFKDDQMQGHEHLSYKNYETNAKGGAGTMTIFGGKVKTEGIETDGVNGAPRIGSTTHGKQIGVNYIIKY